MTVLDIDMDYFQNKICTNKLDSNNFLTDNSFKIWSETEFINFIEKKCCLSKNKKLKGKIFTHHAEAFYYWKQLIKKNKMQSPFKVIHIDTHSDLGYNIDVPFDNFLRSIKEINHNKIFENEVNDKFINNGNYLLCSVIEGIVNEIDYVVHDKLVDIDVSVKYFKCVLANKKFIFNHTDKIIEKNVYLNIIKNEGFRINDSIDYISIAISPPYVKKEIHGLIKIIEQYIDII